MSVKPRCTTSSARRLQRDVNQEARDYTQCLMESEAYEVSSIERKRIETLFGEPKEREAKIESRQPRKVKDAKILRG
jgi:hypothetical protein